MFLFISNHLDGAKTTSLRSVRHIFIDYYIFIIPITVLVLVLALPGIFITGNRVLDTVMINIFIIELYLFGLPVLLLWNFHMVYPNLQFLCSLYDKNFELQSFKKRYFMLRNHSMLHPYSIGSLHSHHLFSWNEPVFRV